MYIYILTQSNSFNEPITLAVLVSSIVSRNLDILSFLGCGLLEGMVIIFKKRFLKPNRDRITSFFQRFW